MSPLPPCFTIQAAYARGTLRAYRADGSHREHTYVPQADLKREAYNNGMGAAAEWLGGHLTHRHWLSGEKLEPDRREDGDLEGAIQVRWTAHPAGNLIAHDEDPSWQRCLLMRGTTLENLHPVAWCYADEAQQEQWWRPKRGKITGAAYFYLPTRPWTQLIKGLGKSRPGQGNLFDL